MAPLPKIFAHAIIPMMSAAASATPTPYDAASRYAEPPPPPYAAGDDADAISREPSCAANQPALLPIDAAYSPPPPLSFRQTPSCR